MRDFEKRIGRREVCGIPAGRDFTEDLLGVVCFFGFFGLAICSGVCDFALVKNFGRSQTISLVSHPKFFTNTKATPPLLRLRFAKQISYESSVNLYKKVFATFGFCQK